MTDIVGTEQQASIENQRNDGTWVRWADVTTQVRQASERFEGSSLSLLWYELGYYMSNLLFFSEILAERESPTCRPIGAPDHFTKYDLTL